MRISSWADRTESRKGAREPGGGGEEEHPHRGPGNGGGGGLQKGGPGRATSPRNGKTKRGVPLSILERECLKGEVRQQSRTLP